MAHRGRCSSTKPGRHEHAGSIAIWVFVVIEAIGIGYVLTIF